MSIIIAPWWSSLVSKYPDEIVPDYPETLQRISLRVADHLSRTSFEKGFKVDFINIFSAG